jgi:SAM-dependent methyltransferase
MRAIGYPCGHRLEGADGEQLLRLAREHVERDHLAMHRSDVQLRQRIATVGLRRVGGLVAIDVDIDVGLANPFSLGRLNPGAVLDVGRGAGTDSLVAAQIVIDLIPDKEAVFSEVHRVLRPGGRMQIADVTIQNPVSAEGRRNIDLWTG